MARRRDAVDQACEEWARVKRELLGLTQPALARGFLGPLRCTLAARRDLHHGGHGGKVEQQWPEFPFRGRAYVVNQAVNRMAEPLVEIMVAHYVVMEPRDRTTRAELLGLSRRIYWERLGRAKAYVEGALSVFENVRTFEAENRAT
jgi:hypothetical protein